MMERLNSRVLVRMLDLPDSLVDLLMTSTFTVMDKQIC
jgi:hypothetical protein